MPRKRGSRWAAYGYDPALKYTKYLGVRDKQREASKLEADFKLRGTPGGNMTCEDFVELWLRQYRRPRESTNALNAEHARRFAVSFRGRRLSAIDRPTARAWAIKHPSSLGTVRAMFGDAERDEYVAANPFAKLRLERSRGRRDLEPLTETELVRLADTSLHPELALGEFGHEFRAMILFAGYVGCRPGEMFALARADVRGQLVTIDKSLARVGGITPPKTRAGTRTAVIPPPAQDALLHVAPHDNGLLFATPQGRMWTYASHKYHWDRLRALTPWPKIQHYELRHVAATMMRERGLSAMDVAKQLGHSSEKLVLELYGHPSDEAARQRILASYAQEVEPLRAVDQTRRAV